MYIPGPVDAGKQTETCPREPPWTKEAGFEIHKPATMIIFDYQLDGI